MTPPAGRELLCEPWPQLTARGVRQGVRAVYGDDISEVNGLSNARLPDRGQIITADVWDAHGLLGTVPEGLSPDEAQRCLELYGNNEVRRHEPYPLWRIALAFEPEEDFVLKRPPRGGQARILDRIVVT